MTIQEFFDAYLGLWVETNKGEASTNDQCVDLWLTSFRKWRIIKICQKGLRDFKREIISVVGVGETGALIGEKIIPILVKLTPRELKKKYECDFLGTKVLFGRAIRLALHNFTNGLAENYQNLKFALNARLENQLIYQIQGITI